MRNGGVMPRARVPTLSPVRFRETVLRAIEGGRRVAALFGHAVAGRPVELFTVLADDAHGTLALLASVLEQPGFRALTPSAPEVHLFEREIAEQLGVEPLGHPWLKPVRFHEPLAGAPGVFRFGRAPGEAPIVGVTDFYRVAGDEVHEVAVGPVHAGVIEPGHFRFQCHGEDVFHLEISLGYQHRGVERALVGGPDKRSIHYMETLAGDTSVGHATAYAHLVEALGGAPAPARAQVIRGIALELERLANHTGDLGALANDVAFLPTSAYCGRIRGDFLNMTATLCGSRFGRGLVRPGGVAFDLDPARAADLLLRLTAAKKDVKVAVELLWDSPSVMSRFQDTGRVSRESCDALGFVGPAARAAGVERDVRKDFPAGVYRFAHVPTATWHTGDVFGRAYVRWLEIEHAIDFVAEQLVSLPAGPVRASAPSALAPDHVAVSLVEGWRGELCHVALTDERGRFARYKVVDPSFHNWTGLALALRDQPISDFPLCNKSFNLSYCGHDL
ncbi:MAG: hydrogenase [Deltaproteobacteria bacterium]|nr:hydrogenase [Deltaproteobacteria bacterium]